MCDNDGSFCHSLITNRTFVMQLFRVPKKVLSAQASERNKQISSGGLNFEFLSKILAKAENRVLHSTSRATHDFISKAAAFGVLDWKKSITTNCISDVHESLERKEKSSKLPDGLDVPRKNCEDQIDHSADMAVDVISRALVTHIQEPFVKIQLCRNLIDLPEFQDLVTRSYIESSLISPGNNCSSCLSKNQLCCISSSTEVVQIQTVSEDIFSLAGALACTTNELLSQESEGPLTAGLQPEIQSDELSSNNFLPEGEFSFENVQPETQPDELPSDNYLPEGEFSFETFSFQELRGVTVTLETYSDMQGGSSRVPWQYCGWVVENGDKMALRIQKVYRGHLARRHFLQVQSAVTPIQTCYQRWLSHKKYCSLEAIVVKIQAVVRGKHLYLQYRHLRQDTLLLQQAWRLHRMLEMNNLLKQAETLRQHASVTTQAHERDQRTRLFPHQWHRAMQSCGRHFSTNFEEKKAYMEMCKHKCMVPFPAASSGAEQDGSKNKMDDWNDVPIDHLDECLDTCLGRLRLLSSFTPVFLNSDISNVASLCAESRSNLSDSCARNDISERAKHEQATGMQVQRQEAPQICPASLNSEFQGLSRRKGTFCGKQNRSKLERFAEVFLLQRHIAQQQRQAQVAPPFPPEMSVEPIDRTDLGSSMCVELLEDECTLVNMNQKTAENQNENLFAKSSSPVTQWPPKLVEGAIHSADIVVDIDKAYSAGEPHDLVIDIKEAYLHSDKANTHAAATTNSCRYPLASTVPFMRKMSAVLILLVTMVVYTRSLCYDVLVWTSRPRREDAKYKFL